MNKTIESKPIPAKLLKDLSLDEALMNYDLKRKQLVDRIKKLKVIGFKYGDCARLLDVSPSAISDLFTPMKDRYDWSYDRIIKALEKLEARND